MTLAELLAANRSAHVLTDGRATAAYADLPGEFARLERLWRDAGAQTERGTVALVGRNELGAVIAALHLLATRRACYFWRPPPTATEGVPPWSELPAFCTATIAARAVGDDAPSKWGYDVAVRAPESAATTVDLPPHVYLGTSGTTARPKLAAYTPERLLGNAANCVRRLELVPEDRVLLPLPFAHMYGLGAALLPAVLAGASVCLVSSVNLLTYLDAERRFEPTVAFLTPGLAHQLVSARKQPRRYRLSVLGADRMDEATFARYEERHGCTVCIYGSTELGAVAAGGPADAFARRQRTSGRLLDHVRLVARDDEPAGTLCFDHPFGMSGYADETGAPVLPRDVYRDGVYITRDVGGLDAQGDLCVRGRRDDCVKRDGYLVGCGDVERALEQLPGVARAVVSSGEATPRGAALIAVCVRQPDAAVTADDVLRRCRAALPPQAVPDRVVFVAQLPLTATGKPDRQAIDSLCRLRE